MTISLVIAKRDQSQKNESLRTAGNVPANVYGPKQEPVNITVEAKALSKVLEAAGESTIVQLTGLEEPVDVLIQEVDFDPVKQAVRHVDFYAIERGKDITTDVPLEFVGLAPAEKNGIGSVTKALHSVEVTCRPSNLPSEIVVDLSSLVDEDSKISVADLTVPEGVVIENDPEDTVAVVSLAKEEVEEEVGTIDMSAIEVEEKGKASEEEEK